jgi:hypothetical protein
MHDVNAVKTNASVWNGDSSTEENNIIRPFRSSSKYMNRHAIKYLGPTPLPKVYPNSDGGRRHKIVMSTAFGEEYSTEESEYESPDEEWYYDPRKVSSWNWKNDYCSLASDESDSSDLSEKEQEQSKCNFRKYLVLIIIIDAYESKFLLLSFYS